jgi:ribosomal subunit interface protein
MKTDWTARGTTVPDPVRQRVEQQLGRLERFFKRPVEASAVLTEEGNGQGTSRKTFEIVLRSSFGTFTAQETSHDLTDGVNAVLARIESQVKRAHGKLVDGKRRADGEPWAADPVGAD